jgi:uncharacterized protein (TIGR02268 family)
MRNSAIVLVLALALPVLATAAPPKGGAKRELKRRTLTITDASTSTVSPLHVAGGVPTTLTFQLPVKENGVLLADVGGKFYPPQLTEQSVVLVAKSDLRPKDVTTLEVTLVDGTILPFALVQAKAEVDLQVDVVVALEKRAAPESPTGLKTALAQVRAQLDECQATAGDAGTAKVAALILGQDLDKAQAFTVERRSLHRLDKQARLLVELRNVYRLFNLTYAVLTVENRDPSRMWVLDRAEVGLMANSQTSDVKVLSFASELSGIPSDESSKVVVVFNTPPQGVEHRFFLSLLEKNGNRHVRLEDLSL